MFDSEKFMRDRWAASLPPPPPRHVVFDDCEGLSCIFGMGDRRFIVHIYRNFETGGVAAMTAHHVAVRGNQRVRLITLDPYTPLTEDVALQILKGEYGKGCLGKFEPSFFKENFHAEKVSA